MYEYINSTENHVLSNNIIIVPLFRHIKLCFKMYIYIILRKCEFTLHKFYRIYEMK